MNAKLCKELRRTVLRFSGTPVTDKKYRKEEVRGYTILAPSCGRYTYRRLKKEFRK